MDDERIKASIEHMLSREDADVLICCSTRDQAHGTFHEIARYVQQLPRTGEGWLILGGLTEIRKGGRRLRVIGGRDDHTLMGCHPTWVLDYFASPEVANVLRHIAAKRGEIHY
jgi:hypothetical protein